MNAFEMLKDDHRRVFALFDRIETVQDSAEKKKIFEEIKQELTAHAELEESIVYPILEEKEALRDIIEDSFDDHQEVRDLMDEIKKVPSGENELLEDRIGELIECVEEHVEIEENDLFPKAEKYFDEQELVQLGSVLQDKKSQFIQEEKAA